MANRLGLRVQEGNLVTKRTVGVEQGGFLIEMFDEWVSNDVGTVFVQMFDAAPRTLRR